MGVQNGRNKKNNVALSENVSQLEQLKNSFVRIDIIISFLTFLGLICWLRPHSRHSVRVSITISAETCFGLLEYASKSGDLQFFLVGPNL